MPDASLSTVVSHWCTLIENLQASPQAFYQAVEQAVEKRQVPDSRRSTVWRKEGGFMSSKRLYFRVRRREFVFDICAAPFGSGFFVSWWLADCRSGILGLLSMIPIFGFVVYAVTPKPTYYRIDTALMFEEAVHAAVLEVIDQMTSAQGVRALSELDRKPIRSQWGRG